MWGHGSLPQHLLVLWQLWVGTYLSANKSRRTSTCSSCRSTSRRGFAFRAYLQGATVSLTACRSVA